VRLRHPAPIVGGWARLQCRRPFIDSKAAGTDRRDASGLAKRHQAGELTAVWVPDAGHEAISAGSPIRRRLLDRGSSTTHQRSCGSDPRIRGLINRRLDDRASCPAW
jgi:hypothetical protein